jgi:TM2 domain-containing membrane protein YozV
MEKTHSEQSDTTANVHSVVDITPGYGVEETRHKRKKPAIAALLSLIIPGLGQVYAGDLYRGFALFAALVVSLCLIALIIGFFTFFATWIFAISDAYKMVKKQNSGIEKRRNGISA